MPIVFLLLFVFVFGGTLGAGLGGAAGGRAEYVNFVVPGILLIGVAGSAQGTAISVSMDMQEGIIARFRTMSIARGSVLTGHVAEQPRADDDRPRHRRAGGAARRVPPQRGRAEWIAVAAVLAMATLALVWVSVAMGLVAKSVESASNMPMLLTLLPFFGSGFVPTDSMPAGLRCVRRVPAVHADHGHPARAPARHPDRQQRTPRRRLVRRSSPRSATSGRAAPTSGARPAEEAPCRVPPRAVRVAGGRGSFFSA